MDLIEDRRLNTNTRKAIVDCRRDVRYIQSSLAMFIEALDQHHDMMRGWNLNATRRIIHTLEVTKECMDAYGDFIGASDTGIDADIDIERQLETRNKNLDYWQDPHFYPRSFYDRKIGDMRLRGVPESVVRERYARRRTDSYANSMEHRVLCGCEWPSWMCEKEYA